MTKISQIWLKISGTNRLTRLISDVLTGWFVREDNPSCTESERIVDLTVMSVMQCCRQCRRSQRCQSIAFTDGTCSLFAGLCPRRGPGILAYNMLF